MLLASLALLVPPIVAADAHALFNLEWPSRLTGTATDTGGNLYVTGAVYWDAIPVTDRAFQRKLPGECPPPPAPSRDACGHGFVAKFGADGQLIWATYLGGSAKDETRAVGVDSAGNVFVAGVTSSTDFPASAGSYRTQPAKAFVAKITPSGDALTAATYLSGGTPTAISAGAGSVYVAGNADEATFPTTPGAFQTVRFPAFTDGFVVKLDSNLAAIGYATLFGGGEEDRVYAILADAHGNAYVTGDTVVDPAVANPFPSTPGSFQQPGKSRDVFVIKLNPAGSSAVFSSVFGGSSGDTGVALTLDPEGNIYVGGATLSLDFPSIVPDEIGRYGFAVRLSQDGAFTWASAVSAASPSSGDPPTLMLAALQSGRVLVAGPTRAERIPTSPDALFPCMTPLRSATAAYALILNASDGGQTYSTYLPSVPSRPWLGVVLAAGADGSVWMAAKTSPVEKFAIGAPLPPQVRCVAHGATFVEQAVAPGEAVSLFGPDIGPQQSVHAQLDSAGRISTELGGVRVLFNGIPAPLLYVGRTQINAVVPFEAANWEEAPIVVRTAGVELPAPTMPVVATAPGVFNGGVLNQDYSANSRANPASPGSVLQVWLTGAGLMSPVPANGDIGSGSARVVAEVKATAPDCSFFGLHYSCSFVPLTVEYAGDAPGLVQGVAQVNIRLPSEVRGSISNFELKIGEDSTSVPVVIKK